jgi:hypothetical protein
VTDERPPIERVLDLVLYAPVGALLGLREQLPKQVAQGRQALENRVQLSHFIGRLAVETGRRELARRLAEQRSAASTPAADAPPADGVPAVVEAIVEPVRHDVSSMSVAAADLPIDGYESLAAIHVVDRLGTLTSTELDAIEAFELAHRSRRTILAKIAQLREG